MKVSGIVCRSGESYSGDGRQAREKELENRKEKSVEKLSGNESRE
jgi:hypothetical protein